MKKEYCNISQCTFTHDQSGNTYVKNQDHVLFTTPKCMSAKDTKRVFEFMNESYAAGLSKKERPKINNPSLWDGIMVRISNEIGKHYYQIGAYEAR